jgi:flagellar biogenesis protein FliO
VRFTNPCRIRFLGTDRKRTGDFAGEIARESMEENIMYIGGGLLVVILIIIILILVL